MITKRLIYEPLERIESAIARLEKIADEVILNGEMPLGSIAIREVIQRDLQEAREKLEYIQEIAP
ncbi:MAG: hypothetical protein ACYC9S_13860 [Leptospirales bacterium]